MEDTEGLAIECLRRLDGGTVDELQRHGRAALGDSALDEWLLPVVAGYGWLFVARSAGEFVGSAEVLRSRDDGELYLEGLYVTPGRQGRGFGRKLLAAVMARLGEEGHRLLWTTLDPANQAGSRLYRGAGFTDRGLLVDHYGPGRDRLLMSAGLAAGEDE
ncbi:MAG: GNAT family N-acetyltransferase [Thermoleophilia bacterium]